MHQFRGAAREITGFKFDTKSKFSYRKAKFGCSSKHKKMAFKNIKQDLQAFLIQRNCGEILKDGPKTDADRKTLIKHAHVYLSTKFDKVEKDHILLLARTLVVLVPSLYDTSEGEYAGFVSCLYLYLLMIHNLTDW